MSKSSGAAKELVDRMLQDTRCMMICELISCEGNLATVKPLHRERVMSESGRSVDFSEMQEISDIPIVDVCGIRLEVEEGTHGYLIFSDVDIDNYISSRSEFDVGSARFHDYNDAVFIPSEIANSRPDPKILIGADQPVSMSIKDGKIIMQCTSGIFLNSPAGVFINGSEYGQHTHIGNLGNPTSPPVNSNPVQQEIEFNK